jgi:hypothetical protein
MRCVRFWRRVTENERRGAGREREQNAGERYTRLHPINRTLSHFACVGREGKPYNTIIRVHDAIECRATHARPVAQTEQDEDHDREEKGGALRHEQLANDVCQLATW